jgi:hypothetical protein
MYCENRGKTAPARERRNVLAAMAEAALVDVSWGKKEVRLLSTYNMRYASTI